MQAMVINAFGDAQQFESATVSDPQAGPGGVLVRVLATSVNPIDTKIRAGAVPDISPEFPAVLHGDVAGEVLSTGAGVDGFKRGDQVFGCSGGVIGCGGALGTRMSCDAKTLAQAPKSMPLEDAAGLPLVCITAWEMLDRVQPAAGQRILVTGGAGGVGHVLIQLARVRGLTVDVVCSAAKRELVKERGAAKVFDRADADALPVDAYDLVFDTVGGDGLACALAALKPGGQVVTIAARGVTDLTPLHGKYGSLHCVMMLAPLLTGADRAVYGAILTQVAELVDTGRLDLLIDAQRFGFADIAKAHARLESGEHAGKVIVTGWPE